MLYNTIRLNYIILRLILLDYIILRYNIILRLIL